MHNFTLSKILVIDIVDKTKYMNEDVLLSFYDVKHFSFEITFHLSLVVFTSYTSMLSSNISSTFTMVDSLQNIYNVLINRK